MYSDIAADGQPRAMFSLYHHCFSVDHSSNRPHTAGTGQVCGGVLRYLAGLWRVSRYLTGLWRISRYLTGLWRVVTVPGRSVAGCDGPVSVWDHSQPRLDGLWKSIVLPPHDIFTVSPSMTEPLLRSMPKPPATSVGRTDDVFGRH